MRAKGLVRCRRSAGMECTYYGSDLARHEPVFVEETDDGERLEADGFCNYL